MWKTVFLMAVKHQLFLIFFECPLICLVSFSIIIRSCLSSLSMPFTIFYKVIRSPLSLLSCRVGSPISFNLPLYVSSLNPGTIFVATLWILPNFHISFFISGDHTTAAYSNLRCIILVCLCVCISISFSNCKKVPNYSEDSILKHPGS